jgi:hypothetical protein
MLIRVMYQDGKTEMVRPPLLQLLIQRGRIQKFRRDYGWTVVGQDPLRSNQMTDYQGPERRSS